MNTLRVIIHGRVQGVGYRAWTVREASRRNLCGWVRNLANGTVEALFHGAPDLVRDMLEACKDGPFMARVERIEQFTADVPEQTNFIALR